MGETETYLLYTRNSYQVYILLIHLLIPGRDKKNPRFGPGKLLGYLGCAIQRMNRLQSGKFGIRHHVMVHSVQ